MLWWGSVSRSALMRGAAARVDELLFDFSAGTLPAGVTVERSTVGWRTNSSRVFEEMAINAARFDHHMDSGAFRGLLFEPVMTNEFPAPRDFSSASWTKTRVLAFGSGSIADDAAQNSADATGKMDKVVDDSTLANSHLLAWTSTIPRNVTCTTIVVAKGAGLDQVIRPIGGANGHRAAFTLSGGPNHPGGSVSTLNDGSPSSDGLATEIKALPGGQHYCRLSETVSNSDTAARTFHMLSTNNGTNFTHDGDGVSGVWLDFFAVFQSPYSWSYCEGTRQTDKLIFAVPDAGPWDIFITGDDALEYSCLNMEGVGGFVTVEPINFPEFSDAGIRHVVNARLERTNLDLLEGPG